ncbi:hypothetical protein [Sphingomonas sp. MMS24-J13]|uniref:hypothetical protein n=1 Tax=Sphingomonas sp. MMS24-J13 TaxID=3238686 RepID=UPI00384B39A2
MKYILLTVLLLAPTVASAADKPPPERISTLVVYGDEPCPRSAPDEIVVCARQPESERYRIPKALRKKEYNAARDGSWAGTAKVLEYVSRQGLPDSCSPTGSYGQSGCFRRFLELNRQGQ